MADDLIPHDVIVPTTGRRLSLPPGPIFHLQRADAAEHEIGAFRAWAGYKDLGCATASDGLVLFQHVLSFSPSEISGRTGIHCHLAQVHIVIPSSGRGAFTYDGVVTEAVPGMVICQHGGTVHEQFAYSYAAASADENRRTSICVDPPASEAAAQSFSFLELFIPGKVADVEIVPPERVTPQDHASAWDHPYHAPGARFAIQAADDVGAAWRPVAGHPLFQARDAATWLPTGCLVATHILRAAEPGGASGTPVVFDIPGETGGLEIFLVARGRVAFRRPDGTSAHLEAGDCLTCTKGLAGTPVEPSADLRLLRIYVSSRAETLRERSHAEIERLETMGSSIIARREVRSEGDRLPVNFLHEPPKI